MSWCLSCAPPCPSALNYLCFELILLLLLLEHMALCFHCQGDFGNRLRMLLAFLDLSSSTVGGQLGAQAWARARLQHSCSVAQAESTGRVTSLKAPPERREAFAIEASHSVFLNHLFDSRRDACTHYLSWPRAQAVKTPRRVGGCAGGMAGSASYGW